MDQLIYYFFSGKKRSTQRFYKNPSDYKKDILNTRANESAKLIIKAKEKHIAKISAKLDDSGTAPKTYCPS